MQGHPPRPPNSDHPHRPLYADDTSKLGGSPPPRSQRIAVVSSMLGFLAVVLIAARLGQGVIDPLVAAESGTPTLASADRQSESLFAPLFGRSAPSNEVAHEAEPSSQAPIASSIELEDDQIMAEADEPAPSTGSVSVPSTAFSDAVANAPAPTLPLQDPSIADPVDPTDDALAEPDLGEVPAPARDGPAIAVVIAEPDRPVQTRDRERASLTALSARITSIDPKPAENDDRDDDEGGHRVDDRAGGDGITADTHRGEGITTETHDRSEPPPARSANARPREAEEHKGAKDQHDDENLAKDAPRETRRGDDEEEPPRTQSLARREDNHDERSAARSNQVENPGKSSKERAGETRSGRNDKGGKDDRDGDDDD